MINLDALGVDGKTRDLTVVGMGSSQLEDVLKGVADKQGLSLHAESHPEAGGYFRSDHFNFAKAGVPAMDIGSGDDLIDGGTAAGEAAGKDYNEHRYHKPGDQYDAATWKVDGVVEPARCRLWRRSRADQRSHSGRSGIRAIRSRPRATR